MSSGLGGDACRLKVIVLGETTLLRYIESNTDMKTESCHDMLRLPLHSSDKLDGGREVATWLSEERRAVFLFACRKAHRLSLKASKVGSV